MIKLYKRSEGRVQYWETWPNGDGTYTVHWGDLGTKGSSRKVTRSLVKSAEQKVQVEQKNALSEGYRPVEPNDHFILVIEYPIEGMGTSTDLAKRHRLEGRMNETLGWTGLGVCDGGSIGSDSMEVSNLVVDFDLAKAVIARDLDGTEFADYARIYDERAQRA